MLRHVGENEAAVADPSVATIEGIDFPNYDDPITGFSFTSAIPAPPTTSTTVTITAVDRGQAIEPEDDPRGYVLLTLQIKLLSASTTSVTVSSIGKLNDDSGADIVVAQPIIPGSVTVN